MRIPSTSIFRRRIREHGAKDHMAKQIYDVIVIGTGAGGGTAIKTVCEAGLKVCALNAGRRLDPAKDSRFHRMPWYMMFRGLAQPNPPGRCDRYIDARRHHL